MNPTSDFNMLSSRQETYPTVIHLPRERRLNLLSLASLIFFTTSGGAFGLEPLVGIVGPGWAVVLIAVTPFVWSLPAALMAAELTALMPEEGGYYVWIREAFGPFWALQQSWWMMTISVVWMAMSPVLFVSYFTFFVSSVARSADVTNIAGLALVRWFLAVLFISFGVALNLRGAREVGRSAKVGAYIVLGSFALLVSVWLKMGAVPSFVDFFRRDPVSGREGALLLGLSYIIYNTSGWENASTYAGEVDEPRRNYPRALAIALLAMILCYLLPVIAGVSVTFDPAVWNSDAGWPVIAQRIGGHWLGTLLAAAGVVSTFGLFNASLLYVSRLPLVLARDGWLPQVFANLSQGTAAPTMALVVFGAITGLFSALSFGSLAVIQCVFYAASMTFEFLALLVLRFRRPHADRSFRVPGGWVGLAYVCLTPLAFAAVVLFASLRDWRSFGGQFLVVGLVLAIGGILHYVRRGFAFRNNSMRLDLDR
ncbi:MAG: hypothetical protein C5B58_04840 [Acidobacteria bacterium]|nr:MAG: hypothetical protein C5B58_04840 [Acidobacteriota bacterium]